MYTLTEWIAAAWPRAGVGRRLARRAAGPVMALGAILAIGQVPGGVGEPAGFGPAVALAQEGSAREAEGKAWLGIGLDNMLECRTGEAARNRDGDDCRSFTVISTVVVGSPAEEAGVAAGDTLISLGDATPGTPAYRAQLSNLRVGQTVQLDVEL